MFNKQTPLIIYALLFCGAIPAYGSSALHEQIYLSAQDPLLTLSPPAVSISIKSNPVEVLLPHDPSQNSVAPPTGTTELPLVSNENIPTPITTTIIPSPITTPTSTPAIIPSPITAPASTPTIIPSPITAPASTPTIIPIPIPTSTSILAPAPSALTVLVHSKKSKSLPMPAAWVGRDDVINPDLDFQALLAKSKVSGALPIKNNTTASISIHIRGQQRAKKRTESVELDLTIAAGQTLNVLSLALYESMKLNTGSQGFLNFYSTKNRFKIAIEPQQMLIFPRTLNPFTFVPNKETACLKGSSADDQAKIDQYWGHVGFIKHIVCRDEKINPVDFYLQRQRLYEAFKLESIIERPLPYIPRIPLNLFSIWLTNLSDPKEPDQELIDLALGSSKINKHKDGWNHFFLVQDPNLFPQTKKDLEGSDVRLVSFAELLGPLSLESELAESIADRKFGMASDILRVEALDKMGGGYLDIDLQILQSLKLYFYAYHSMFGIEPMSEFIGNAFMASSRNHPIMQEMISLIKRNFALKRAGNKSFYSSAPTDGFSTIVQTGPCVSTVAFYNAANRDGRADILMPPEAFYPAKSLKRPEFGIPTLNDSINIKSATLHLWLTTWAGARGAKNGSCG